jgi:hypothetical protein
MLPDKTISTKELHHPEPLLRLSFFLPGRREDVFYGVVFLLGL